MNRREVLVAIALAGVSPALPGCSQREDRTGPKPTAADGRVGKLPRIGCVANSAAAAWASDPIAEAGPVWSAFYQGLRNEGLIEGQNVVLERRTAENHLDRLPQIMRELVALPVDAIFTNSQAAIAAHEATDTIPIVAIYPDFVAAGFTTDLAKPSGNITGFCNAGDGIHGKRLELLKSAVPTVTRVGLITNAASPPGSRTAMESAARKLKLDLVWAEVDSPEQYAEAFATFRRKRVDAIHPLDTSANFTYRCQIIALATKARLPAIYIERAFVDRGGLLSYGQDYIETYGRAAPAYLKKILEGKKTSDLPIEQPKKFEFLVNAAAATQIGLAIPSAVVMRADEVIDQGSPTVKGACPAR